MKLLIQTGPTRPSLTPVTSTEGPRLRSLKRAGFTLAELMVVIVIIGLLSTIVAPKLFDRFSTAQVSTAKANMVQMEKALVEFRMNNNQIPDTLEVLVQKDDKGTQYLNMDVVPKDPWGNEFVLEQEEGEPVIWCLGADGSQGGEGKDMDFSTKMIRNREI